MISPGILIFIFGLFIGVFSMGGRGRDLGQSLMSNLVGVSTGFTVVILISMALTSTVIDAFAHTQAIQFAESLRVYQ